MTLFLRSELRDFLLANLERQFATCDGKACVVHAFLTTKTDAQITVTEKRCTFFKDGTKEGTEHRPWLSEFIHTLDLHGSRLLEEGAQTPTSISGQQALDILTGVPY